jgi:hypothetical protein
MYSDVHMYKCTMHIVHIHHSYTAFNVKCSATQWFFACEFPSFYTAFKYLSLSSGL